jgi:hypothetical protein
MFFNFPRHYLFVIPAQAGIYSSAYRFRVDFMIVEILRV